MSRQIELFVPGRLCLAGEHSDWASSITSPGAALVVGLSEGLRAIASESSSLTLSSLLAGTVTLPPPYLDHARSSSLWRFAAAVAHVMQERYSISGMTLTVTEQTLPAAKGLSSSAAICVLVARAFNRLYGLRLTVAGEMEVAYTAERLTGSLCGRMDQIVAIGAGRVARMKFEGECVSHEMVCVGGGVVHVVLADLGATKDTKAILAGLNEGLMGDMGGRLREVLGKLNVELIDEMEEALRKGEAKRLGELFSLAQRRFDEAAIPFCPGELTAPVLHAILADVEVKQCVYGGKGVGSQGDGAVQFVAKDYQRSLELTELLRKKLGTEPIIINIGNESNQAISKVEVPRLPTSDFGKVDTAVIPAAGFGTRLFPASRHIRPKALFPIVDVDGFAKPVLLHLVEHCVKAGLKRVVIVVSPGESEEHVRELFFKPVPKDLHQSLKPCIREYADRIAKLGELVDIALQHEPKGFGHAVHCANVTDRPFMLLLGDVVFRTCDGKLSCLQQVMSAFERDPSKSVIGVKRECVKVATAYGVVSIASESWESRDRVPVLDIVEKPDEGTALKLGYAFAGEASVRCNIILGPYVFTPGLMKQMEKNVLNHSGDGEIQLTPALHTLMRTQGIDCVWLEGGVEDMGQPEQYVSAVKTLAKRA